MRTETKPFPTANLKGSWHEMGVQYGQDCREEICYMQEWWKKLVGGFCPEFDYEKGLAGAIAMYESPIQEYAPRWIEFMKGVGEGAGLDWRSIYWVNVASNLLEGQDWAKKPKVQGCTAFAVEPERTDSGKTYLGMNLDWTVDSKFVCLHMEPDDAPAILGFCMAGCLPQVGISSVGFGSMVNGLTRAFNKRGVPMNVICAEVLLAKNLEDACQRISLCERAMSFNHLLAHKDGSMVDIETTAERFQAVIPENGRLIHTNHYLTKWLQEGDLYKSNVNTFVRYRRAEKFLDECEKVGIDTLKSMLSDHHGTITVSLCSHNTEVPFEQTWGSVLSVIAVPEDGVVYATEYPCENEYAEYRL